MPGPHRHTTSAAVAGELPEAGAVLLVVDLEPMFRVGLRTILEGAGHAVEPSDVTDLLARLAVGDVTGLVLDARVGPGDYGAELVRQARAAAPGLAVTLVVGTRRGPGMVAALEAGVGALLHRRCAPDELLAAVDAAAAGRNWVGGPLAGSLQDELLAASSGRAAEPLTARELEVLSRLALGGTNAAIGRQLGISEHTVRNHVRALMAKLGVANRTDAVATAARRGLVDLT